MTSAPTRKPPREGGFLCLDCATTTGFAAGFPGEEPVWGSFRLSSPNDDTGEIFAMFHRRLNALIDEFKPRFLIYESPYLPRPPVPRFVRARSSAAAPPRAAPPINMDTIRRLVSLCGIAEMTAAERGLTCFEQDTSTITKTMTGTARHGGREHKKRAVIEMCRRYGWNVSSDNEADALAIFVTAEVILVPEIGARRGSGSLFARA